MNKKETCQTCMSYELNFNLGYCNFCNKTVKATDSCENWDEEVKVYNDDED